MAILLGQHLRVGNEDNLWNSKRERITTVQQVEAIVDLSRRFGRKVATADEAREIMKIGVSYDSVEETLRNLGLPPNRAGGERGFMVWENRRKEERRPCVVRFASDGLLHSVTAPGGGVNQNARACDVTGASRVPGPAPTWGGTRQEAKSMSDGDFGKTSVAGEPGETGPWDSALAMLREWDPAWGQICVRHCHIWQVKALLPPSARSLTH
jgi:hypothetical protein